MKKKAFVVGGFLLIPLFGVSCVSLPPDQIMRNDQTRFDQQQKRYPDREDAALQRQGEKQALQDSMQNKR